MFYAIGSEGEILLSLIFVYLYNKTTCFAGGSPSGFSPR
nr:MAG TPA: hypothetical protein [Caudoviricetes sp.]